MTEHYVYKNMDVECWIEDNGRLTMILMDGCKVGCLTIEAKVLQGRIPWPSMKQ